MRENAGLRLTVHGGEGRCLPDSDHTIGERQLDQHVRGVQLGAARDAKGFTQGNVERLEPERSDFHARSVTSFRNVTGAFAAFRYASRRMKAMRVAVVVTGEPIEAVRERRGSWVQLMREALGDAAGALDEVDARTGELPDLRRVDGVIVTGSAASVTECAPWMLDTQRRLAECVEAGVPVLGVCFGHQLLAQALGGEVQRNPRGREIGSVRFELTEDDAVLSPGDAAYDVNMTHVDAVVRLPPGAKVLGRTELDPYAALRFAKRAWGVQFHPEMDADVMHAYVSARAALLQAEGLDSARILAEVRETPASRAVLGRFLAEVAGGGGRS